MSFTVFYSWQSELPSNTNRGFVKTALDKAVRQLEKDGIVDQRPEIDQDTKGVPGSPDIVETIFRKIRECDVFVADVSIVNTQGHGDLSDELTKLIAGRPSPNSNVLIELGYALHCLGPERVIILQNTFFGDDLLPFDLSQKRVMKFTVGPEEDKAPQRDELTKRLASALKEIYSHQLLINDAAIEKGRLAKKSELKKWHDERAELITHDKGWLATGPCAHLVGHVIPVNWQEGIDVIDFSTWTDGAPIRPFLSSSWRGDHNRDGYLAKSHEGKGVAYVQLFRDGRAEVVAEIGKDYHGGHVITGTYIENALIEHLGEVGKLFSKYGLHTRVWLYCSIVKGHNALLGIGNERLAKEPFKDLILPLPEVEISDLSDSKTVTESMKLPFNRLWQAAGQPSSPRYRTGSEG